MYASYVDRQKMGQDDSHELVFFVNGNKVIEKNPDPETTLLQYLRIKLRLTGSKSGCSVGACGACTVMVSRYDKLSASIHHVTVNACLAPVCSMHGQAVTTVEGIGSTKTKLHPVQERLAASHGSQCGFCTPGMVMSMYTLLRNNPQPLALDVQAALDGNLCRCTGYRPILEGFKTFTKEFECPMGDQCCRNQPPTRPDTESNKEESGIVDPVFAPYDPTQEPIFPSELQMSCDDYAKRRLVFKSERVTWYRPTSLQELIQLKHNFPAAYLLVGNSKLGIEQRLGKLDDRVILAVSQLAELNTVELTETGVRVGAAITLSTLEGALKSALDKHEEFKTRTFAAIIDMLKWFGSLQIRNVVAIGSVVVLASSTSDLNPLLLSAGCILTVVSVTDSTYRKVRMDKDFFLGDGQTSLLPTDIVVSIQIPFTTQNEYIMGFKQAQRKTFDAAIVNAGFRVLLEPDSVVIKELDLSFGGLTTKTASATKTSEQLIGRKWDDDLIAKASELLSQELPVDAETGGREEYRSCLASSFFFKFYLIVRLKLEQIMPALYISHLADSAKSGACPKTMAVSKGVQLFEEVPDSQLKVDAVGRPLPHLAAQKQATGEAVYVDDMPYFSDELYLAFVVSTRAHAKIVKVDASKALTLSGVVDFLSHTDVPGHNEFGAGPNHDEEIFASQKVSCQGQIIGAIVASSKSEAQRAAKVVIVEYEELEPIITIEQAIAANSFLAPPSVMENGDVEAGLAAAEHVVEGELHIGGQVHFYMETQTALARPQGEDGILEVYSSTQDTTGAQEKISKALGVDYNKIIVSTKRAGGAFGGKEMGSFRVSVPVAVAAHKHGRAVRCALDRDEDMATIGTRHPYLAKWKVGFTSEGKFLALDLNLYSNGGMSTDLSPFIMMVSLLESDGCYNIPSLRVRGHTCKTNIPSNTAFRGFGNPQAMLICEDWVTHVARTLNMTQTKIREVNMYKEGEKTFHHQTLTNDNIRKCWDDVLRQSDYETRKQQVYEFNKSNRWKKRGIFMVPIKMGIAAAMGAFGQQAGALVHVYTDGSVMLSHGGVEMGQGLNTKMIQVASRVLKIPTSKIYTHDANTSRVPNSIVTAGSIASDMNGMAVIQACETIMERLAPLMAAKPDASWEQWIQMAFFTRISLSATGYYKTAPFNYDMKTKKGDAFLYFTVGAACTEVEIDCLTGDHTILRTDIVMDVGTSLNPAIDIGQIEGAFVQGYGLYVLEDQKYSPDGYLRSRGPDTYKIPTFANIPLEFNVTLLKGSDNPKAVYSSKGIGEPPMMLSASVFFAIKDAIESARTDAGITEPLRLNSPATAERIRMACIDQFTKQVPASKTGGNNKPWVVQL